MWFEDLSPCTYFPTEVPLTAVGWLDADHHFTTGPVDRIVYDALIALLANPWQPLVAMGPHQCNLCRFKPEARGSANLFLPAGRIMYVSPEMILHYINAHGYAPPKCFCDAALSCPPMRSMNYLRAVRNAGGARMLTQSGSEV